MAEKLDPRQVVTFEELVTKVVEAEKFVLKDIHGKVRALAWANSRRGPS